jgi:calcyclin binding protein
MSELAEAESLLAKATFPAIQKLLQDHISSLKVAGQKSDLKISDLEQPSKAKVPAPSALPSVVLPVADVTTPATAAAAKDAPTLAANASPVVPVRTAAVKGQSLTYIPIEDFAWDQGEYGSNTVSIFVDLTGVGAVKDRVEFSCTKSSFDLKVTDLNGKNYRLIKENLDKDIIVSESKIVVKKDKVVIKLRKLKGEYSYENWTSLTAKKKRDTASEADKKANPMGGIMDMMKDMYDDGDENMKKIIGEAMMKSQRGEKPETPAYDDM